MRDGLPGLQHESKRFPNLRGPCRDGLLAGKIAKRVIDFDRGESLGIVRKHLLLRNLFWIEAPFPLLVTVTAGANKERHKPTNKVRACIIAGRHYYNPVE